MLTIRLSRIGKKNKPMYRLVISEKARDPYGRALEILGSYNPYTKELKVKAERVKHWLSQGSGMSATVNNLLIRNNITEGKIVKATKIKKKNKEKKEASEKAEAASDSKEASSPEASPAGKPNKETGPKEEKPAEEKPKEETGESDNKNKVDISQEPPKKEVEKQEKPAKEKPEDKSKS